MRKVYKVIKFDKYTDEITIYGTNRWQTLYHREIKRAKQSPFYRDYFIHKGQRYDLADFLSIHNRVYNPNPSEWKKEFDGEMGESFFNCVLVKVDYNNMRVKVYFAYC